MTISAHRARRALPALMTAVALVAAGVITGPGAVAAPEASTAAQAVAPPPAGWPSFGYQGVITDKDEMIYNPTNEYIFPSVFHAGAHLSDPLGEWYLYAAPHDSPAGIILMYADSLEGPWTEYAANPIIASSWSPHYSVNHVSSPDAIWNEAAGEVFLYFHGANDKTRYAHSTDGVNFTYGTTVVSNSMGGYGTTETSYARVFEHPDPASSYEYGMFYMSNQADNIRRIRLAESVDGVTWTVDPNYVVVPGSEEGQNVSGANLWEWNGQLYVTYHASSGKSYARTIDETLRVVGTEPIVLHQASGVGDDVGRVASPEIVTFGGETYLFYESGDRLGATVAWAKDGAATTDPTPGTGFGGFPEDPANPVFAQCAADGSDEFEGTSLASGVWDRELRPMATNVVAGGTLTMPTSTGGVAQAPLLQQELPTGAWQFTTHVQIDPTQSYQQAGLLLYASDTHYAKLDLGHAAPGRTVELVYKNGSSNRQDTAAPQVAGATEIWLRYTSDGTSIRASVSYDGVEFDDYGRDISVASAAFTHVGPYAFRGTTSAPEIDASFSWVRFSPTAAEYESCM